MKRPRFDVHVAARDGHGAGSVEIVSSKKTTPLGSDRWSPCRRWLPNSRGRVPGSVRAAVRTGPVGGAVTSKSTWPAPFTNWKVKPGEFDIEAVLS